MTRNDKTHIPEPDKVTYMKKWVAFVSRDWEEGQTPVSTIIASSHSLEACNAQDAVLTAWANKEVVINEYLGTDPETFLP
jgi:hypothetical protein